MPYGAASTTLSYDIENRVIQAVNTNGTERYGYGSETGASTRRSRMEPSYTFLGCKRGSIENLRG